MPDPTPANIVVSVYPQDDCAGCGHLIRDDGTETVGHFVDNGDRSVGLPPSAGCFVEGCKCEGPAVGLTERNMADLCAIAAPPPGPEGP